MSLPSFIDETKNGVVLHVKVHLRSKKNEIVGVQGDELHLKISAPPVDFAANIEIIKFLAKMIGCGKSCVSITRGQTSRHKTVLIVDVQMETIIEKLAM